MSGIVVAALGLWVAAGLAGAQEQPNTLTAAEEAQGWQLLFDGRTLSGWEARPTSTSTANGDWTIENGALLCPGTTAGWLATTATFSDFHLMLQFRGGAKVNSGVFLRSQKQGQPHVTGYELQIWDYQPAGYNTGSLVGTVKATPAKIVPDQWNNYDITADGDHYVVVLNGKTLLDARDPAHRWGVIGFQCQVNNKIEFRSVRVLNIRR